MHISMRSLLPLLLLLLPPPTACKKRPVPVSCALSARRYTLALGAGGIGAGLFIGGFVVKGLQDE